MNWIPGKINYDILIPPLEKSIYQLSERETANYFELFMHKIPERITYLSDRCASDLRIRPDCLDLSPESLLLLWKWFRRKAKTETVVQTAGTPEGGQTQRKERQLTLQTEFILRDIGMYLGETFVKNHEGIYWTYYTKPKRDFFVNHPLLKGFVDHAYDPPFEMCFEPVHMARVQASKLLRKRSTNADLLNLYQWWADRT